MGVNISIIVQRLDQRQRVERDYDGSPVGVDVDEDWGTVIFKRGAYARQNYFLYDLFAGIRKGCAWGQGPIFPTRGMPSDLVERFGSIDEAATALELGEHNFSWLRLDELFAINWDTEFRITSQLDILNFARVHFNRRPIDWGGHNGMPDADTVTPEVMRQLVLKAGITEEELMAPAAAAHRLESLKSRVKPAWLDVWCQHSWITRWRDHAPDFIDWVNGLKVAEIGYDPEAARIVYGFAG